MKLKHFYWSLRAFFRKCLLKITNHPPLFVNDSERIVRGIFDESQYYKKTLKPKSNLFSPPNQNNGESGISVIRLNYSSIKKCKYHCKKISKDRRQYLGFAYFNVKPIRDAKSNLCEADVESTPIYSNSYPFFEHADIFYYIDKVKYVRVNHEPVPSELKILVEDFIKDFKCYIDPNVDDNECIGFSF